VLAHHVGVTLAQPAVDDHTKAITAVATLFARVVREGRLGTRDALLTPRHVAHTMVAKGGDAVMIVPETPPRGRAESELVVPLPPGGDRQATARTVDWGHGRIEQRKITPREALVGDSDWPGLAQVFARGRHVRCHQTGEERGEGVYGVTSLRPARAPPARLRALVRGQWQREPQSPGVRDVPCEEDRSQGRGGNMPQVRAAFRHTAMGLRRGAGHTNIAAACRRLAAQPGQAWALIGIELEN
jgi:hypothetical protein